MYKNKINIDKQFLIKEYIENKKSSYEIANEIGCSRKSICIYLKKYNIKPRGYTFFKGHIHKSEVIKKISLSLKGREPNEGGFKKGCKVWNEGTKGVMKPNEGSFKKENHYSIKTEFKEGMTPWNKNVPCSKKTKEKISKVNKGKLSGEKHPAFNNWSSREPYGVEFSPELKERIRKRDNYECQECHKKQEKALCIHHIDYNKKNNNPLNLISLCTSCHMKTNFNRKHWTKYFKMKMFIKELFNPENILVFNENKQLMGVY